MVSRGMCGLTMVLVGYENYNNKMTESFCFLEKDWKFKSNRKGLAVFEFSGGNSRNKGEGCDPHRNYAL